MAQEKDWNARFVDSKPAHWGWFIVPSILLFALCSLWALFALDMGFHDSMGNPRNENFLGHILVFALALVPFVVPGFLLWLGLRRRRESIQRDTRG